MKESLGTCMASDEATGEFMSFGVTHGNPHTIKLY